jgi:hypothetical protein
VSYQHRGLALGVALRRAYGAALYLESDYPGIADRVDAVIDAVPSDDVWTSRSWMAFSIVVRRSCLGLPFSEGDTYSDHAIWMLRRQLARVLLAAHAELLAEQRRKWTPRRPSSDEALPGVE